MPTGSDRLAWALAGHLKDGRVLGVEGDDVAEDLFRLTDFARLPQQNGLFLHRVGIVGPEFE